jgi:hypothetical protein
VSTPERPPFDPSLRVGAAGIRLAAGRNAHGHARKRRGRHAEDVRVEIVRVQQIELPRPQEVNEPPQLTRRAGMMKPDQGKFTNGPEAEPLDLFAKHSPAAQRRHLDVVAPGLVQEARELYGLAFRPALIEAVDEMQNPG